MDLGTVGAHDAKMTQSDSDPSNDMSYGDVCEIPWKEYKVGKGSTQERTERIGSVASWELMIGRVAEEMTEERRIGKSKPSWYGDRDKGSTGHKRQGQGQREGQERTPILLLLRIARTDRSELSTQVDQQHQGSSWESA